MTWTVEVGSDLRRIFWRARKDKDRFPPRGLTQEDVARKIGKSQVWYRQIESGYVESAGLDTVSDIAEVLGIDVSVLDALGYSDVAEELRARVTLSPQGEEGESVRTLEVDFANIGKLSDDEREALLIILRKLRGHEKPLREDVTPRGRRRMSRR